MPCSLVLSQDVEVGDSPVLSMCVVRDKVWMGFEIGYLMIFDSNSRRPHVQVRISKLSIACEYGSYHIESFQCCYARNGLARTKYYYISLVCGQSVDSNVSFLPF